MSIKRPDLPIEVDDVLDSTGNYMSEWVDSSKILSIRVAATGVSYSTVQESNDAVNVVRSLSGVQNGTEVFLTARYFRVQFNAGTSSAGAPVHAAVRAVS
jgi:hypothetical protein